MEGGVLLGAACVLGFAGAAPAGAAVFKEVQRAYTAARMQTDAGAAKGAAAGDVRAVGRGMLAYVLRNGVGATAGVARWLVTLPQVAPVLNNAARLAQRKGFTASPESVASAGCVALVLVGLVCVLGTRSVLAGLLVPTCLALVTGVYCAHESEREKELLRDQVPDALRCMEACLHAGLSLPQAFAEVAAEVPSPAKESFAQVSHDLEMGYSMDEALVRFHRLSGLPELGFVAMALDVQYACGGSATPILRSAEESISRGLELRRSLRVQTAQGRLSAQVVTIMPFCLLAILSVISPGFLDPFFADVQGFTVFALAIAMQVLGVLMVRAMLKVELS